MLLLPSETGAELWVCMGLSVMETETGSVSEGRFIENSTVGSIPPLCRAPGSAAGRTAESSLIRPSGCCMRAELCCQQILPLWRCIHNWTASLLLHCPPETLWDKAINTRPQHLTSTLPCLCCWWVHRHVITFPLLTELDGEILAKPLRYDLAISGADILPGGTLFSGSFLRKTMHNEYIPPENFV